VKEQAPLYQPGLDGQRESCIVLLYVKSLDKTPQQAFTNFHNFCSGSPGEIQSH
jgi:hypothetical protein